MSYAWLIESLAEMKAYAEDHDLAALADHLETALQLAHLELAQNDEPPEKRSSPCGWQSDRGSG